VLGRTGVGKTRLVRRFAAGRPSWIVDLGDAHGQSDVLDAVARALRSSSDDRAASVRASGRASRRVVVLDNVERVTAPLATLSPTWLPMAPETTFLVTSRVRLRVNGEVRLELGPLSPAERRSRVLRSRASDRAHVRDGRPHVAKLIERLDRLPLAIELAAARADLSRRPT
jgi:predicted ATPase